MDFIFMVSNRRSDVKVRSGLHPILSTTQLEESDMLKHKI
jgi:hypothetical protein